MTNYAQPLGNRFSVYELLGSSDISNLWRKNNGGKYYGLNISSLIERGHLEIRNHSGTTNAEKILHWVALHTAIVDIAPTINLEALFKQTATMVYLEEKTDLLFSMLKLTKETTDYLKERQESFRTMKDENDYKIAEKICVA
jgi:hypothetical protein